MSKEMGRLFNGYKCNPDPTHSVSGTHTCQFIRRQDIPVDKRPTYVRIAADYREQKTDPYRV